MSGKHTPGRLNFHNNNWQVSTVYSADGKMVAQCLIDEKATEETQFDFEQIKEANARRIVACWNACAGLDTELLENSVAFGVTVNNRFDSTRTELRRFHVDVADLRKLNADLLAMLIEVRDNTKEDEPEMWQRVDLTIAKAQGGEA